ncbi:hypothetical protein [Deinococcus marmoris]|uniref:hypothetical protein n=1 Tax=Deinococcus marmoris TaxID=249408 RepID=UPI0012DE9C1B|nr:hypothetical protein [Deinococcus marmoris]
MPRKKMSSTLQKQLAAARFTVARGQERLVESITGSLRVAGYAVKRSAVAEAVTRREK